MSVCYGGWVVGGFGNKEMERGMEDGGYRNGAWISFPPLLTGFFRVIFTVTKTAIQETANNECSKNTRNPYAENLFNSY